MTLNLTKSHHKSWTYDLGLILSLVLRSIVLMSFTKDSPQVSKNIYTKGLDRGSRGTLCFL